MKAKSNINGENMIRPDEDDIYDIMENEEVLPYEPTQQEIEEDEERETEEYWNRKR